jgi:hypothetical protein
MLFLLVYSHSRSDVQCSGQSYILSTNVDRLLNKVIAQVMRMMFLVTLTMHWLNLRKTMIQTMLYKLYLLNMLR